MCPRDVSSGFARTIYVITLLPLKLSHEISNGISFRIKKIIFELGEVQLAVHIFFFFFLSNPLVSYFKNISFSDEILLRKGVFRG